MRSANKKKLQKRYEIYTRGRVYETKLFLLSDSLTHSLSRFLISTIVCKFHITRKNFSFVEVKVLYMIFEKSQVLNEVWLLIMKIKLHVNKLLRERKSQNVKCKSFLIKKKNFFCLFSHFTACAH